MSSALYIVVLCIFAVMLTFSRQSNESHVIETSSCGQSSANFRARIVNGQVSSRGWWPWQIAIYKVPNFHCGGALISRRWVLTAAHCFYHGGYFMSNTDLYQIKAGDHNLSVNETSQQEIPLQRIFVHPRFKQKGAPFFDGDLALVKLSQEVKLGGFVRTVCLPEKSEGDLAIPNKRGTVAGWGVKRALKLGERVSLNDLSKVLRHATFTIKSDQLCKNKSGIQFNSTTAFCAGDGKGNSDSCHGDSGGAFVREIRNSKWVVVGVVSWGNGCAQKDQYGYYTRIHPFLDWIKETMERENPPCPDPGQFGDDFRHGKPVTFTCPKHYHMVGVRTITCSDGRLSSRKPSCEGVPYVLSKLKAVDYHKIPAKITVKVGENVNIPCLMEYRLTSFAWMLCHSNCQSFETNWKIVITIDEGSITLFNPEKYGLDSNGSLVVKSIQLWDNGNWFRCFYRKRFFGLDHRTSIILIEQECERGIPFLITDKSMTASSQKELYPGDHGVFDEDRFWCSKVEKTSYIEIRYPIEYKIIGARIQLLRKYKIKSIIIKIRIFDQWINIHYVKSPYSTSVRRIEPKPFIAQFLRIRVLRKHSVESICLRAEVLGCNVPKGCILQGSAILIKRDGGYRRGFVGGIFHGWLEVFQFGETKSTLKKAADVILDEKPDINELINTTLVLGEDVNSPGVIREGNIEQVGASSCTIKTNNERWKSNLNYVRIVKISNLC